LLQCAEVGTAVGVCNHNLTVDDGIQPMTVLFAEIRKVLR
jgi:hypothetical protein